MTQTFEAAKPALDSLAAKLGVAAGHMWAVLVRQAYVDAFSNLVFMAIIAVMWFYAIKGYARYRKLDSRVREDVFEDWIFAFVFGGIIFGILTIAAVAALFISIGELVNPEYYAIKTVLDALK